jgi:site-specific recombinase XerD
VKLVTSWKPSDIRIEIDPATLSIMLRDKARGSALMDRRCQASTRNVRLSAIHTFFRYLGTQHPEHLAQAQRVLSVPFKRTATREIQHLERTEIQALLQQIDRSRQDGDRDFVLLSLRFTPV